MTASEANRKVSKLPDLAARERFRELRRKWKEETFHLSVLQDICMNINYLRIIAMGEAAVPWILDDLRNGPDFWFVALSAITSIDLSEGPESRTTLKELAERWIKWGIEHGYAAAA